MSSHQYRKSHCGDKTILRPSYLHNGISYIGKTTSLYWIGALGISCHSIDLVLPEYSSLSTRKFDWKFYSPSLSQKSQITWVQDNWTKYWPFYKWQFQMHFLQANVRILIQIEFKCVPGILIDDKSTLIEVMAWCHQALTPPVCWLRSFVPLKHCQFLGRCCYVLKKDNFIWYQLYNLFFTFFSVTVSVCHIFFGSRTASWYFTEGKLLHCMILVRFLCTCLRCQIIKEAHKFHSQVFLQVSDFPSNGRKRICQYIFSC